MYDPRPLTLYRIHGDQSYVNTSSLDSYMKRRCKSAKDYASDYKEIMKRVEGTPYEVAIKPLMVRSRAVSAVFCPSESKPTARELMYLLKQRKNDDPLYFLLLLGLEAACVLPPLRGPAIRAEYELARAIR